MTVRARDFEAAQILAERTVRHISERLNFFSDLLPYNHSWIYLPAETASARQDRAIIAQNGKLNTPGSWEGPIGSFSMKALRGSRWTRFHLRALRRLTNTASGHFGRRLLSAIQLAGRATTETLREQSFLLHFAGSGDRLNCSSA